MDLNKQQLKLVDHFTGPCVAMAVPGSGKTASITERVARLIEKGVKPQSIICLTFTNKAASEMKQRICERLGVDQVDFVF